MERGGSRKGKMEGHFSTGQSRQWAVMPMEEEEEEDYDDDDDEAVGVICYINHIAFLLLKTGRR